MNVGIVGYASQKLSADSGSSINPLIRGDLDRGFGAGGEWKYTDIKHKLAFDVRYEQQFGVELPASGKILLFNITYLDLLRHAAPSRQLMSGRLAKESQD